MRMKMGKWFDSAIFYLESLTFTLNTLVVTYVHSHRLSLYLQACQNLLSPNISCLNITKLEFTDHTAQYSVLNMFALNSDVENISHDAACHLLKFVNQLVMVVEAA